VIDELGHLSGEFFIYASDRQRLIHLGDNHLPLDSVEIDRDI
jgi:hypothetical protein